MSENDVREHLISVLGDHSYVDMLANDFIVQKKLYKLKDDEPDNIKKNIR